MCWFTFFCFYSICGQKPNPNDNTRGFSWSISYPAPHKPFPSLLSFIKSSSALPVSSPTYPSILQVSRMNLPDKMTLNTFFPQIQVLAFSFLCVVWLHVSMCRTEVDAGHLSCSPLGSLLHPGLTVLASPASQFAPGMDSCPPPKQWDYTHLLGFWGPCVASNTARIQFFSWDKLPEVSFTYWLLSTHPTPGIW